MIRTLRALFLSSAILSGSILFAQDYSWDAKPALHAVPDIYNKESAVFILEKRNIKYVINKTGKKNEISVYRTIHRIIRLLDDKGVEYFNKMTVSSVPGALIQNIQGRTIKASGKVVDLAKDQIRTNNDEHGQLQYHLAFEGVEKGDEVELFYTEKRPFAIFGSEVMQFGLPVAKASFQLEVPEYLYFDSKGYNNFPNATDTIIDKVHHYSAEQTNLDAIEDEEYSDLTPNLKRIEYKVSYSGDSRTKLYTWNDLAGRLFETYYTFTDKEQKAVRKFLEPMKLDGLSEEEKIKRIEETIKQEIVYDEQQDSDEAEKLGYVLEKKAAGETGLVRLYVACFEAAGVQHDLGSTSNRFEYPLDDKFENWNRPNTYVFYFPGTKQYLSPGTTFLRYPMIPAALRENKALFCKRTTVGNLTTAIASIRHIPVLPMEESADMIKAEVSFDKESMSPEIKMVHAFKGYAAMSLRETVSFIPKDKEKDFVQNIAAGIADQPEDIVSYSFNNKGLQHYSDNKPVEIHAVLKADKLMETAGSKWLFKVGDVIGPQAQMYQDKKRKLPISMPYPHSLIRDITINIPEGYKITNPESVKIDVKDEGSTMGFKSDYTINDGKMQIHINEFYSIDHYPATTIEPFRKVINAAADFNKVTLVLEKQ